ncbi:hypothetical protein EG329_013610 [Mollisiaceae sp. DMI_Dod_QoI]|nr:hypothetical protein EG329_013610 [Helotiales sp. DMI_Dod_QoI]
MPIPRFGDLPLEVQILIWEHVANQEERSLAIRRAQTLGINHGPAMPFPRHLVGVGYTINCTIYSKRVPAILQVCQNSRAVAKRFYQLLFGGVDKSTQMVQPCHRHSRGELSKDLAKVRSLTQFENPRIRDAPKVARFAPFDDLEQLLIADWHENRSNPRRLIPAISQFWDVTMNPKRIADGKQRNWPPSVDFVSGIGRRRYGAN